MTAEVFCVDDATRNQAINAVRRYRAYCREVFAVGLLAETAGAKIVETEDGDIRVQPDSDRAKATLAALMMKDGKAHLYQLRQHVLETLYPTARSFVWDSLRRDVSTRWCARDPEFGKASRGWLTLQGARDVARFNGMGIGFPQATAHPKLEDHAIRLTWDREVGEVEFKLKRLDSGRWGVWSAILSGDYTAGTLYLNERDGKLRITITYSKAVTVSDVDPARVLLVEFLADRIRLSTSGDTDEVMLDHAKGALARFAMRRANLEARRASCGSPKRPWGHRKGWLADQAVLSALTARRAGYVKDQNHAWARRIADRARQWRCGRVSVTLPADGLMHGQSWGWGQLKQFISYKVEELGGEVVN
jgi:hypothetical protein